MTVFRSLAVLFASSAVFASSARASGYEFEGVGARQVSRAGAATAAAEDWTAIYWNPAGLSHAARQAGIELFGGWAFGRDSNSLSAFASKGLFYGKDKTQSSFVFGAAGAAIPLGERVALGVGVYTPLLNGFNFADTSANGVPTSYKGAAAILASNVSLGVSVTPELSVGAGFNLLYGRVETTSRLENYPVIAGVAYTDMDGWMVGDGFGYEGVVGAQWKAHPRLSLAAVYRTGADVRIRGDARATSQSALLGRSEESSRFRYSLNQPPTADLGAAWKASEGLTLTCDLHQTFWHRFTNEMRFDQPGALLPDMPDTFRWRDTWKLRFGSAWKVAEKTELLGGYSFDPYSVDNASVDMATTVDVTMHRFSAGVAQQWGKGFESALGVIGGYGYRKEGALRYGLSGVQLMAETSWRF
ncbi:MAG: outer membrane protein transport protein [Elusimicrobiota bacterium]|jgi:long-chain fatty acid transport protein